MKTKKGVKELFHVSVFVEWFYDRISDKRKESVLERKKTAMTGSGNLVKEQIYIPKELYIVLDGLGAFQSSGSAFYTQLAMDYADKKISSLTKVGIPGKED